MQTKIEGEYKITELGNGVVIKEINQDDKPKPLPPEKPGKDLNLTALNNTDVGKALLIILKHFNLV